MCDIKSIESTMNIDRFKNIHSIDNLPEHNPKEYRNQINHLYKMTFYNLRNYQSILEQDLEMIQI